MKRLTRPALVLLSCLGVVYVVEGQQKASKDKVNPDARVLAEFQKRVEEYVDLRDKLEDKGPAIKETKEPAHIRAAQDALAQNIRAARKAARPGDIFTPDTRALFRRLMYPELKGRAGTEAKQVIKEDAPAPASVAFKVNAKYPEDEPLPTVPPKLLAALPKLPEGLEYRIVGKNLILRDADSNLIVDFIPNAIQ